MHFFLRTGNVIFTHTLLLLEDTVLWFKFVPGFSKDLSLLLCWDSVSRRKKKNNSMLNQVIAYSNTIIFLLFLKEIFKWMNWGSSSIEELYCEVLWITTINDLQWSQLSQPMPMSSLNHAHHCIKVHLFTLITVNQLLGLKGGEKKSHAVTRKTLLRTELAKCPFLNFTNEVLSLCSHFIIHFVSYLSMKKSISCGEGSGLSGHAGDTTPHWHG